MAVTEMILHSRRISDETKSAAVYPSSSSTAISLSATIASSSIQKNDDYYNNNYSETKRLNKWISSIFCALGIYIFFITFGIIQEEVFRQVDPHTNSRFTYSFFLVFMMCLANLVFSFILLFLQFDFSPRRIFASFDRSVGWHVLLTSLSYVVAMLATNYALEHVSYPTQVLVKSAKTVPVILGGFLLFGKTYPWYDYVSVTLVTLAITLFNFLNAKVSNTSAGQTGLGLFWLFISLLCDGMTGPRLDKINSIYRFTSLQVMGFVNIFAVVWAGLATMVFEGTEPIQFCFRHVITVKYILFFCCSSAMGQACIFYGLQLFGSLYLTCLTTSRKFFTVVCSVVWFEHRFSFLQWVCVTLVFTALLLQSVYSKTDKSRRQAKAASAAMKDKEGAKPPNHNEFEMEENVEKRKGTEEEKEDGGNKTDYINEWKDQERRVQNGMSGNTKQGR